MPMTVYMILIVVNNKYKIMLEGYICIEIKIQL